MKHGKFPGALRRKFLQDAAALGGVAAATLAARDRARPGATSSRSA